MVILAFYASEASLITIHRLRMEGRLDWLGKEIRTKNLKFDASDSCHLHRPSYHAPKKIKIRIKTLFRNIEEEHMMHSELYARR